MAIFYSFDEYLIKKCGGVRSEFARHFGPTRQAFYELTKRGTSDLEVVRRNGKKQFIKVLFEVDDDELDKRDSTSSNF